jgi:ATP-dependent Lon protease
VIMPRGNQKALRDLPEDVRKEMEFFYADRVEDVLAVMLPGRFSKRGLRRALTCLRQEIRR